MTAFTRQNPSPEYHQLLKQYQIMHSYPGMYSGTSLTHNIPIIKKLIHETHSKTLLDYGAGKGEIFKEQNLIDEWELEECYLYEPAYAPLSQLPDHPFDAVICIDVLEHCSVHDIPWILDEIFSFAKKLVFLAIACYPAQKLLPNKQNAHITQMPPEWWRGQITLARGRKNVHCLARFDLVATREKATFIAWKRT